MPCLFTVPKMFCACLNVLRHPQNLIAFGASSKTFVPAQKQILLNANHLLVRQKMFVTGTVCKYIILWFDTKNLDRHKTFWDL